MGRKCEEIILRDSYIVINGAYFILALAVDNKVYGLICCISFRL
jgi:hypothetical protein